MPADELHQPHDGFFKQMFGRPPTAAAHFQRYLPPSMAELAEWDALEQVTGSFVDPALRQQESDLLFRVPFKGQFLYLYLLFEHQRKVDPWMPLRLLSYMVQIWRHLLKADPELARLPPVVPMVLYQGAGLWTAPKRFLDLLAVPEGTVEQFRLCQPDFEYLLLDLSRMPAEELRGDLIGRLGLSLMKAVAEERLVEWLERSGSLLAEVLRRQDVVGIFETLLRYMFAADSNVSFDAVREVD